MLVQRHLPKLIALFGLLGLVGLGYGLSYPDHNAPSVNAAEILTCLGEPPGIENVRPVSQCAPTAICKPASLRSREVLRQGLPRRVGSKHLKFDTSLVSQDRQRKTQLPSWLPRLGVAHPAFPEPSSHVLFCTWLE
jgi:hypothetical protein